MDETDPRITISQTTGDRTVRSSITTINATTSDGGTYVCQVGTPPGTGFNTTDSDPALILVQGEPGFIYKVPVPAVSILMLLFLQKC